MARIAQRIKYSQSASTTTANLLNATNLQYIGLASKITIWAAAFLTAAGDQFSLTWSRGAEFGTLVPAGTQVNVDAAGPSQLNDLIGEFTVPAGVNMTLALVSDGTSSTHTGVFAFLVES
jgi:hypothetical protein